MLFRSWLIYESYFQIGALCPWCLLVTITTTLVFVSMLRVNLLDNNFRLSESAYRTTSGWLRAGADTLIVILIVAAMAALIFLKYGSRIFG